MTSSEVISLECVSKSFGLVSCLRSISIAVRPDEVVAVVGPNGSGKTTLLDVMSGMVVPDTGTVRVYGSTATGKQPAWYARRGLLRTFQSPRAFEQMSVEACLALASETHCPPGVVSSILQTRRGKKRVAPLTSRVRELIARLDWGSMMEKTSGELSYGQRKLLAVAQLYFAEGALAICDEPTAGLDARRAALAVSLLRGWKDEACERSLVIATHDLDYCRTMTDRIYRLEDGQIWEV